MKAERSLKLFANSVLLVQYSRAYSILLMQTILIKFLTKTQKSVKESGRDH